MKRISLSLLTVAFATAGAVAAPVSRERATQVATEFAAGLTGVNHSARQVLTTQGAYYVVNLAPQGWVIVAADDAATPVLGYNTTGSIDWHNQPEALRYFLSEAQGVVKFLAAKGKTDARWKNIRRLARDGEDDGSISPIIKVNWDQGSPYNQFCPMDGNTRSYVGCVAVAMGQVMSSQSWPPQINDSASMAYSCRLGQQDVPVEDRDPYDWDLMLSTSKANASNGKEIARLLRHTGVSVRMDYGKDGSGIPSNQAERISQALVKYFEYPEADIKCTYKYQGYTNDNEGWKNLIYNELDAGRAVVYNAVSMEGNGRDAGHSFNIDGYQGNTGFFHVNWGWGGSSNGYYDLLVLGVQGYKYNRAQVAITGIGGQNRSLRSIALSDNVIDENLPAGTCVGAITVNGETPSAEFTMSVMGKATGGGNYEGVPFVIENGFLKTTRPLSVSEYPNGVNIKIRAVKGSEKLNSSFNIIIMRDRTIAAATSLKYDRQTGRIDLRSKHGVTYQLADGNGAIVARGAMDPLPASDIQTTNLPQGTYTLTLQDSREAKTIKIVK